MLILFIPETSLLAFQESLATISTKKKKKKKNQAFIYIIGFVLMDEFSLLIFFYKFHLK